MNTRERIAQIMSEWNAEIEAIMERAAFEELGILSSSATDKAVDAILDELMELGEGAMDAGYETICCPTCGYSTLKEQAAINWQAILTHIKEGRE